jgi:5-formyltetrahydrofolate cyclo-ligase
MDKNNFRTFLRFRRTQMTDEEVSVKSASLCSQLTQSSLFDSVDILLGYYPCRNEVDCRSFLESWLDSGKKLALPVVAGDGLKMLAVEVHDLKNDVIEGYKGILEPDLKKCSVIDSQQVGAVLIPGLGFDSYGNRLGQGGGHYDRFLQTLSRNTCRIALAYDWQVLNSRESVYPMEELPVESHDLKVDLMITPTRIIPCTSQNG